MQHPDLTTDTGYQLRQEGAAGVNVWVPASNAFVLLAVLWVRVLPSKLILSFRSQLKTFLFSEYFS